MSPEDEKECHEIHEKILQIINGKKAYNNCFVLAHMVGVLIGKYHNEMDIEFCIDTTCQQIREIAMETREG